MASVGMWRAPRAIPQSPPPPPSRPDALCGLGGLALFVAPFVALAIAAHAAGFESDVHRELLDRTRAALDAGRLEAIGFVYPPLPALVALVWRGAFALSVLGAVLGGTALWVSWRRLTSRGTAWWLRVALVGAVGATPAFAYEATESLPVIGAVLLLVLALDGYLRFVLDGDTAGGFTAGLLLGLAVFVDFFSIIFAVALALAAPALVRSRLGRERGTTRAVVAVILFPTVAAAAGWLYVEWVSTGSILSGVRDAGSPLSWSSPDGSGVGSDAFGALGLDVLRSPIYLAVGLVLATRVRLYVVAWLVAPLIVFAIRLVGFDYDAATTYLTLSLVALMVVPADLRRGDRWLLLAAAGAQLLAGWAVPALNDNGDAWMRVLGGG